MGVALILQLNLLASNRPVTDDADETDDTKKIPRSVVAKYLGSLFSLDDKGPGTAEMSEFLQEAARSYREVEKKAEAEKKAKAAEANRKPS
jgi:hypothetical protein